jgi:iron complex transport system ATP-binding protein
MSLLAAENLTVSFNGRIALDGAEIAVARGETVGLLGPNAAGKTTLLRVLAALIEPRAGRVLLDGMPLAAIPRTMRARRIGYLPQNAACHWPLTVERLAALGRIPHLDRLAREGPRDRAAVMRALADCDVGDLASRPVTALSGGEQARAMLARALAGEPELLLADEPVAQLDPWHQLRVMELMRAIASRGGAVLVALHDLALAARFCDRLVLLDRGRVAADGAPAAVLTPPVLARVFGIKAAIVAEDGGLLVVPRARLDGAAR